VTLPRTLIALLLLGLVGCGAAPAPDLHAAFRRIQEHEAVIARQAPDAEACPPDTPCPAAEAVCAAAASICSIAIEVDDPDARARCELARRRCEVRQ
jgi:hypothetical protein